MVTLSNIPFSFISLDTNLWTIRLLMLLRGMSMAFSFVPLQAVTYANISKSDTGRASAIFSTQRQMSAALGVAVLSTIFISRFNHLSDLGVRPDVAMLGGYRLAFAATAVISGAGAILASLTLRDADAASTMHAKK
jgi:sugar phosphate permease